MQLMVHGSVASVGGQYSVEGAGLEFDVFPVDGAA